jgi:acyl-CoA dehydrogenase
VLACRQSLQSRYIALEKAAKYAKERIVFQRPIGINQGVAHPLADAYVRLEAAKLATYHGSKLYDSSKTDSPITTDTISVVIVPSIWLLRPYSQYAEELSLLAGEWAAPEYNVGRYFWECPVPRIAPVSREMILNYVSEKVLDLPRRFTRNRVKEFCCTYIDHIRASGTHITISGKWQY